MLFFNQVNLKQQIQLLFMQPSFLGQTRIFDDLKQQKKDKILKNKKNKIKNKEFKWFEANEGK